MTLLGSLAAVRIAAVHRIELTHLTPTCLVRWEEKVTVVHIDMRLWDAPEKADILVSELLGSFGDNELSPECLDGAHCLQWGNGGGGGGGDGSRFCICCYCCFFVVPGCSFHHK